MNNRMNFKKGWKRKKAIVSDGKPLLSHIDKLREEIEKGTYLGSDRITMFKIQNEAILKDLKKLKKDEVDINHKDSYKVDKGDEYVRWDKIIQLLGEGK